MEPDKKIVGQADAEDLNEIIYLHSRVDEANRLLEEPQRYFDETVFKVYMESLVKTLVDAKAKESQWWTKATSKYNLNGEITIDFATGNFVSKN